MNETLLYLILGVLYLVFTILGRLAKKKQQQTQKEDPWSLEDALRDLQTSSDDQPEVAPVPAPRTPSDWPDEYTPYIPSTQNLPTESPQPANPYFETPGAIQRPVRKPDLPKLPDPPTKHVPSASRTITSHLKDPKSARTAIILREILGRPKGARGFPGPRVFR
ncbi:MAG: hypothetical protein OXH34_08155 [Bacteroidetes bacterium]|nr:hypothetical protein [Bacteroidota bacterium]